MDYKEKTELFNKLNDLTKNFNIVFTTLQQPSRETTFNTPRRIISNGDEIDIIIIDHVSLIQ